MTNQDFKYLISNAKYSTKYEPILNKNSLEIFAYEALSKFELEKNVISTEEIFKKLHHNNELFFNLEKRNKELQIRNFDQNKKLFINFDADIFISQYQKEYWENFLKKHKNNIVVEITENGSDDEVSAKIMQNFSLWLNSMKIDSALDDFAQEGSMFSYYIMNNCNYIKIDKSLLHQIRLNKSFIPYLEGILKTIRLNGKKSIIEGVETKDDLDFVKSLDCDYIQGYFFSDSIIVK